MPVFDERNALSTRQPDDHDYNFSAEFRLIDNGINISSKNIATWGQVIWRCNKTARHQFFGMLPELAQLISLVLHVVRLASW